MPAGIIHRHCPETKKALDPVSSVSSSRPSSPSTSAVAGFGTNEWLVEEMYQQYVADPASVDQAWHEFFADYRPGSPLGHSGDREAGNGQPAAPAQAAAPTQPKPAEQKAPQQQAPAATETKAPEPKAPEKAPEQKAPATPAPAADSKAPAAKPATPIAAGKQSPLRGASAAVVKNMN